MSEPVNDRLTLARSALEGLRAGSPVALAAARELLGTRDLSEGQARVRLRAEVELLEAQPPKAPATAAQGQEFDQQQHPRGGKGTEQGGQFVAKGESGARVSQMQGRLNELGHTAPTHGKFDDATQQAVMGFQRAHGLPQTGVVDTATLEAMRTPPTPAAQRGAQLGAAMRAQPSKPGDAGDHVATLQDQLATLGFPTTDPPGEYGSSTAASVRRVQQQNGLAPTGHADPQTVAMASRLAASVGPGGGMEERGGGNLAGDAPGTWGLKPTGGGKKRHLAQSGATGKPRANPRGNSNRQRAAKGGGTALRHADEVDEASHQGGVDVPYGGAVPFMAAAVRVLGPIRPPGLRESDPTAFAACASCVFFGGGSAGCERYGGYPVDRGDLCDSFKTLTPDPKDRAERDQHDVEPEVETTEAFDEAKHPREHGKFAKKVLGAIESATRLQSSGMGKRSSFGGNLHRVTVSEGPGGSAYSFDRRPDGSWHHTHTSGWGGTTMANTIGKVPDSHAKKLEQLDAAAAKEEIATLEKMTSPDAKRRLAVLKAQVESGYHTGPSAIKAKTFQKGAHVVSTDPRDAGSTLKVTHDDGSDVVTVHHPQLGAQGRLRKHLKLDEGVDVKEGTSIEEVKSDVYPGLDRSPKANWVEKSGGLPSYIERIAKHLHYEQGKSIGNAIQIAVGVVKRWCAGGSASARGGASKSNVSAATRAKACAAVAQWEAKKAKSKASSVKESLTIEEACADMGIALALFEQRQPIPPSPAFCEKTLAAVEAAYDDWDRWGEDGLPPAQESLVLFAQDDAFRIAEGMTFDPDVAPFVIREGEVWQLRVAGVPVRLIESAGEAQIVEATAQALHVSMRRANPKQVRERAAAKLRGMKGGLREHVGGLSSADASVHAVVSSRFAGAGAKPRTLRRDAGPGSFSHPRGASAREQDDDPDSQAAGDQGPAVAGHAGGHAAEGGVSEAAFDEAKHRRGPGGKWIAGFHARMETQHFTFDTFGSSEHEARDNMRKAWLAHAAQTGADPGMAADLDEEYGMRVTETGLKKPGGHVVTDQDYGEHHGYGDTPEAAAKDAKRRYRKAGVRVPPDDELAATKIVPAMRDHHPLSLAEGLFDELKHPRGRGGKFRDVLGQIHRAASVSSAHVPDEHERAFVGRMTGGGMHAPSLGGEKKAAASADEAIGNVLGSFPGLKDWHVDNAPDGGYHVRVTMDDGEHHIHVAQSGEVRQADEHGHPKPDAPVKATPTHHHGEWALTGETETPFHMDDGQVYQGKKGGWFRKLEHDAHHKSPTSKSGWTGAMTHVEDLQTGEKKWIAHFPIKDYEFPLAVPKGMEKTLAPKPVAPAAGELASQVAPNLAGGLGTHAKTIRDLAAKVPAGGYMALEGQPGGEGYHALAQLDELPVEHFKHLSPEDAARVGDTAEDVNQHGLAAKARMWLPKGESHAGPAEVDFAGKNVVVTGKIEGYTRPQVHGLLSAKGAMPHSTVGEDTHYLITGEKVGAKKTSDAAKKGVKVVSWADVKHLLEAELTARSRRALAARAAIAEGELSAGDEAAARARLEVLEGRMVGDELVAYRKVMGDPLALLGAREGNEVLVGA